MDLILRFSLVKALKDRSVERRSAGGERLIGVDNVNPLIEAQYGLPPGFTGASDLSLG